MATNTTEEYDIAHRQVVAYLKGQIVGYAVNSGMKWVSTKEQTPEFIKGFQGNPSGKCWVTVLHIIHNRLRHDRPHMGSVSAENELLSKYGTRWMLRAIEEELGEEAAEKVREVCDV